MSTSGSINFNQTRDQIITDALQLIGRLGEGESATANALSFGSNILNKLIKHWETMGIHLWSESEGTVFMREGINKYILSSTGDKAADDSTVVETTLASDGSGTSITVDDSTGMTIADNIGIELDDGTRQWTTITNIAGNVLTLNSALTGAASENNTVFSYTTILNRPIHVMAARLRLSSSNDQYMHCSGRTEFMQIVNKTVSGTPNTFYYSPQRDNGVLYVWPTPSSTSFRLKISYMRAIEDFDSGSDNPDLPQEWLHALTYNLARMLAPSYGVDLARRELSDIVTIAAQSLEELKLWDKDQGSIYIIPNDGY